MIRNDRDKRFRSGKSGERPIKSLSPWSVHGANEAGTRTKLWGVTNTISTVSKDNYLVLPAILTAHRTEFGKAIRKKYDSHQIHFKRQDMREWIPKGDGTSNTITSVTKDNVLMEQNIVIDKKKSEKRKHGLPAEMLHLDNLPEELKGKKVYIRKLTPRECYRLMDVSEENIDKLMLPKDEKGKPIISNSGHYKLAGNSIVVSCITAMFRNLIIGPPERDKIDIKEAYPLFRDIDI